MHGPSPGNATVTLDTMGGLTSLASPNSLPEGASPRTHDTDFVIGDVVTRDHQVSVYSYSGIFSGPNPGSAAATGAILGVPWTNPNGIFANDPGNPAYIGQAAGNSLLAGSDPLNVTGFAFNLPSTSGVTGVVAKITGYATAPTTLSVALIVNGGVNLGALKTVPIGPTDSFVELGGASDTWGQLLNYALVNGVQFGLYITAQSTFSGASVILTLAQLTIYQTASLANMNYGKTFTASDGTIRNLWLDADGILWVENVSTAPGVLTLLLEGTTPASYSKGFTGTNTEFIPFSDLTTGSDVPRQYNAQGWIDRISQVGPGAPPVFTATTGSSGDAASITAWTVASGIITFTATNAFTAGEIVTISGLSAGAAINGLVFEVLGVGLSGSQFEVNYTGTLTGSATEAGLATPQYSYPIVASPNGITQIPPRTDNPAQILWSAGPGSQSPGNVVTVYYNASFMDEQLVNLFNSGQAVYVFISGAPIGNGTQQVTSVGVGKDPGGDTNNFYFTFQANGSLFANYRGTSITYQISAATVTTVVPVPGLSVGQQFTIAGASPAGWNNLWTVTQTLNSTTMSITETSMVSGVATYSYALVGGSTNPPAAGELVTITNTLNGGGVFNVIDVPIASVPVSGPTGQFTISGFPGSPTFGVQAEEGQATTAGTSFVFDPGPNSITTVTSPIFGNGGGGVLSLINSGQVISSGTKQGVVFFITRNGYQTAPSPPVQFTVPENSNYLLVSNIPIGPPNVVARGIALTESGQNGVPGANFFTLPTQVQFVVNGVTFTSSALLINDNVTTSAKFTFSDPVLLNGTAIDVEGNNLFNLIEIGNPAWIASYAFRNFYGLCQNKLQNFLNLSFDGGFLPGNPYPLGWNVDTIYGAGGSLINSPVFGNSYYIQNTTAGVAPALGMLFQNAFQDAYQVPIIAINTLYSVRVTARVPSGKQVGNLIVDLVEYNVGTGFGNVWGTFSLSLGQLTPNFAIFTGTLLTAKLGTVPPGLVLRYWAQDLISDGDLEIDRIEVFPTAFPVLTNTILVSYVNRPEAVDGVTGKIGVDSVNQQPVTGMQVQDNVAYLLKESSWFQTQATENTEPSSWDTARQVSLKAGACGPMAHDQGEGWIVAACRNGLYCFTGGQPGKINQELYPIWDLINWSAGKTIWVRNDVNARKLYVGVPLPTPNFWLPNAAMNAAPTTPNVILMCNYQGVENGSELQEAMSMKATMFGDLRVSDMRRKWSIWQIPCPYADFLSIDELDTEFHMGNGIASSKVYNLQPTIEGVIPTDDGAPITTLYTTYGWNSPSKIRQNPAFGPGRIRWGYGMLTIEGAGLLNVRMLPNSLIGPNESTVGYFTWTVPGGFQLTDPSYQDREFELNIPGYRMFVEFSTAGYFNLSSVSLTGRKDPWNTVRGIK